MKNQSVVCYKCKNQFEQKPKLSLMAFQKFQCPNCSEKLIYPITKGYRQFYWLILIGVTIKSVDILTQGDIPIPGIIVIFGTLALIKDYSIRKQIKSLQAQQTNNQT